MKDHHPYTVTAERIAWSCPWYQIQQHAFIAPDGTAGQYNYVDIGPCVFVVPVTDAGEIVLIHQYRYPVRTWSWEIPAGGVKADQTELEAAAAELHEEIGGTARELRKLTYFHSLNSYSNEIVNVYLALGVELGTAERESTEIMTIHPTPIPQALKMARTGQIKDGISALALLLAEPYLS